MIFSPEKGTIYPVAKHLRPEYHPDDCHVTGCSDRPEYCERLQREDDSCICCPMCCGCGG